MSWPEMWKLTNRALVGSHYCSGTIVTEGVAMGIPTRVLLSTIGSRGDVQPLERETRLELATSTLEGSRSTN
jgi:hypothetical protein